MTHDTLSEGEMQRFYDFEAILRDVTTALDDAINRHGLDTFHPVALCAVIEAIASPLKAQNAGPLLMRKVGTQGVELYLASLLARRVEVLKSPHSLSVNPMMDAVVMAVLRKGSVPKDRLFREALKVHLNLSGRSKTEIDAALKEHAPLEAATHAALDYLQRGGVITLSEDGSDWEIAA